MNGSMKAIIGAVVGAFVLFYVLTTYVFNPIAAANEPGAAMNPFLTLAVVAIVGVLVLDWINGGVGNPVKSGMIMAVSQIALVDIYYPMTGQRAWITAVVSAVVLLVGWSVVGVIYGKLSDESAVEATG